MNGLIYLVGLVVVILAVPVYGRWMRRHVMPVGRR
jgi:hypothetical protein